jgi:hypothetical protein
MRSADKSFRVGLVACSAMKLKEPARARELYTSTLFKKSLAVAERECGAVYILSALHHLVKLDDVIKPYDLKLTGKERSGWAVRVRSQLTSLHQSNLTIAIYAGKDYASPLALELRTYLGMGDVGGKYVWRGWGGAIEQPLAGMMFGERLSYLNGRLADVA